MTERRSALGRCAASLLALPLAGCEPTATIEDLGTLGGTSSIGLGINAAGNVTGSSFLSSTDPHFGGMHAFRFVDGLGMIDVGALQPGNIAEGDGINSSGFVVGGSIGSEGVIRAFHVNAILTLTDIGTLGGEFARARDINDAGVVTGEASTASGNVHAFVWTVANGMRDLGTLGGSISAGFSINQSGQVAGESSVVVGGTAKVAFRFTEGAGIVSLGTLPGGAASSARGINDAGRVVGESDTGLINQPFSQFQGFHDLFGTHAFLWTEGSGMADLGHLGGGRSSANAINNDGVVVGTSTLSNGTSRAFRWTQASGMVDLNTLLPAGSGWVLEIAHDVNDRGQITGEGLHNGQRRAFRYNPPEVAGGRSGRRVDARAH
jgi:probable HAF family extracellular repeat protein